MIGQLRKTNTNAFANPARIRFMVTSEALACHRNCWSHPLPSSVALSRSFESPPPAFILAAAIAASLDHETRRRCLNRLQSRKTKELKHAKPGSGRVVGFYLCALPFRAAECEYDRRYGHQQRGRQARIRRVGYRANEVVAGAV